MSCSYYYSPLKLNIIHTKMRDLWSLGQASLNVKRQATPLEGMHSHDPPVSLVENITHVALMIIRLENLYILADRLATS